MIERDNLDIEVNGIALARTGERRLGLGWLMGGGLVLSIHASLLDLVRVFANRGSLWHFHEIYAQRAFDRDSQLCLPHGYSMIICLPIEVEEHQAGEDSIDGW